MSVERGSRAGRWRAIATRRAPLLALAFLAFLPLVAFIVAKPPVVLLVGVGALFLLTLARPLLGWLVLIAVAPFGDLLGRLAALPWRELLQRGPGSPVPSTEPVVLAFLAGWFIREALRADDGPSVPPGTRLVLGLAGLFALAVTASMAVQLIVEQVSTAFPLDFAARAWRFLWHDYYLSARDFDVIPAAAFMLEGVGLLWATIRLALGRPAALLAAARTLAWTASAVAAVNVLALVDKSVNALPPLGLRDIVTTRVSFVFPDVNAAGSYFVVMLFVAGGLAATDRRWRRPWIVASTLSLIGLALAGSRTAIGAVPVAACCVVVGDAARRRRRAAWVFVPGLVGLAILGGVYAAWNPRSVPTDMEKGVHWRVVLSETAVRMARSHPVFGVGPGRFYDLSPEYLAPEERTVIRRENAHNNFLQVLAETGAVGLGLLMTLLVVVLRDAWRRTSINGATAWLGAAGAGLIGFVATWATGHPLLTREVALAFWSTLGLVGAAAWLPESGRPRAGARSARAGVAGAALVILVLVPIVADRLLSEADLSRAGHGFSQWHRDRDDTRFRWMARRAVLYVPASAKRVSIAMRSPGGAATVRVLAGGTVAAQVVVAADAWTTARVDVPRGSRWRFVPLTLEVRGVHRAVPRSPDAGEDRIKVALGQPIE